MIHKSEQEIRGKQTNLQKSGKEKETFSPRFLQRYNAWKNKKTIQNFVFPGLSFFLLVILYVFLYRILARRINAFGCFDDCFNYVAGYFMLNGKTLYSQIFFNHQPLMATISLFVQSFTHPINIYDLILRHKQFVLLVSFFADFLLILRFGIPAFGFVFLFELSKFYLFGDRFLAESLIVYPLVYLVGLVFAKLKSATVYPAEYILAAIFVWFVVFMRIPYLLVAVCLYVLFLILKFDLKKSGVSLGVLLVLILGTFVFLPIKDYFFDMVTVNYQSGFLASIQENGLAEIFLFPFLVFSGGAWNAFRYFLIGVDTLFLLSAFLFTFIKKDIRPILFVFLVLGFANIRPVPAGEIFYAAFHEIVWFAILIFSATIFVTEILSRKKILGLILFVFSGVLVLWFVWYPKSYFHDPVDPQAQFLTNFGYDLQIGEVVRALSQKNNTLFLDGSEDLIYWQAKRLSPYQYSWYTSVMPYFTRFTDARVAMFQKNPPDFYFFPCNKTNVLHPPFPTGSVANLYVQLYASGKPACLFIKKSIIPRVSKSGWQKAHAFFYDLAHQSPE